MGAELIHFENRDCMEAMREFDDGFFDLAIVDPPYGGGFTEGGGCKGWFQKYHQGEEAQYNRFGGDGSIFARYKTADSETGKGVIKWDVAPDKDYFDELFRVSKNQIIWGEITFPCRRHGASLYGAN